MFSPLHDLRRYACPGEPGDVSRSIHLARLAASYSKCRGCPHQRDTGVLPTADISHPIEDPSAIAGIDELIRTADGWRGSYLNQLDRSAAVRWAAALGALLWEDGPPTVIRGADQPSTVPGQLHRSARPTVVIGYDERPAAPDLVTGAALGLQRMSCQVIDLGLTTAPCLAFAIHHLAADAGLYVTGSGCDPAWIGFDLRLQHGLPPDSSTLDRWQTLQATPLSRPSRRGGSLRAFPAVVPYEANLWKHFHALRPLQVVVGTTSAQSAARLERIFSRLPGRIQTVRLPIRRRKLDDPADGDVLRISESVREQSAHLGILIDDDSMACALLDERGELIPSHRTAALIAEHLLRDHGGGQVVFSADMWDAIAPVVTSLGGQPLLSADADLAARLMASDSLAAFGGDHRHWFGGNAPTCDAILTLAVVLQILSLSDADFSQVLSRSSR